MPRIRIVGRDGVARFTLVKGENLARYAPISEINPKTNRRRTVFVKQEDTLVVPRASLDPELVPEDDDGGPLNVEIIVTAGSDYSGEAGNDSLIVDAVFTVVVAADDVDGALERIKDELGQIAQQSGLPIGDFQLAKVGADEGRPTSQPVGLRAQKVRMGPKRNRLRQYSNVDDAARNAVLTALGGFQRPTKSKRALEAERRLSARLDAKTGRWRAPDGRFTKAPSSVVLV